MLRQDIIIYSCVRTNSSGKTYSKSGNGKPLDAFWADERRMNVAITRAKSSLWIVGNSALLERSHVWHALIQDAKQRNAYMVDADVRF